MKSNTKIPMRQCTGCRQMMPKKELCRVIKTKEGEILLDTSGRLNGRGAYVCKNKECFEKALKTKGLERSLQSDIPLEVINTLKEEFENLG